MQAASNYKPPRAREMGPQGATTPIFQDFCEETTAHAFFQVGDPGRHWWARFMWLIILVVFTGVFGWQFGLLAERYYKYEVNVNTAVVTEKKMQFPTISVCNINPYQVHKVPKNSTLGTYLALVDALLKDTKNCSMTKMCNETTDSITMAFCDMMADMNPHCPMEKMLDGHGQPKGRPTGVNAGVGPVNIKDGEVALTAPVVGNVKADILETKLALAVTVAGLPVNVKLPVDTSNVLDGLGGLGGGGGGPVGGGGLLGVGRKRRSFLLPNPNNPPNIASQIAAILTTIAPSPQSNISAAAATTFDALAPSLIDAVSASIQSNLSPQQVQAILSTLAPTLLSTSLPVAVISSDADPALNQQPPPSAAGGASGILGNAVAAADQLPNVNTVQDNAVQALNDIASAAPAVDDPDTAFEQFLNAESQQIVSDTAGGQNLGQNSNLANLVNGSSQLEGAVSVAQAVVNAVTEAVRAMQSDFPALSVENALATAAPMLLGAATDIVVESVQMVTALPAPPVADAVNLAQNANLPNLVTGISGAVNANVQNVVNAVTNAAGVFQSTKPPPSAGQPSSQDPSSTIAKRDLLNNGSASGPPSKGPLIGQQISNITKPPMQPGPGEGKNGPEGRMSLLHLEALAAKIMGTIGQMQSELFGTATQPYDDLVQDCRFNMGNCSMTNDSAMRNPWYGACYSFNKYGNFESVRPGPLYGLAMQLFVNKEEYLPNVYTVGVRVSVDQPGRTPFPEIGGVFVPVGTSTAIAISVIENQRKGPPYSECIESDEGFEESNTLYYKSKYTPQGCQITCLQREIVKTCGCWHFAYQKPPDNNTHEFRKDIGPTCKNPTPTKTCIPLCDFNDNTTICATTLESKEIDCTCDPICTDQKYQLTVTESVWPAHGMPCPPDRLGDMPDRPGGFKCNENNTDTFAKENQLKLMVYYESLTKFTYTESEAYSLISLISDFGGQLGLWIGASFCTVIEIISLLISLVMGCCGHPHSIEKKHKKESKKESSATDGPKWHMKGLPPKPEYQAPPRVMY